jgi:hypothetical protein
MDKKHQKFSKLHTGRDIKIMPVIPLKTSVNWRKGKPNQMKSTYKKKHEDEVKICAIEADGQQTDRHMDNGQAWWHKLPW